MTMRANNEIFGGIRTMADDSKRDEVAPRFVRAELDVRIGDIQSQLTDAYARLEISEHPDDVAEFQKCLDLVMKFSHDCRHVSRGLVK